MSGIATRFLMTYPAMSAYEFDHFREEADVREHWSTSSLYMICQRPVLYFDQVLAEHGVISGSIRQRGNEASLRFELELIAGRPYFGTTRETLVEFGFYDVQTNPVPPLTNVAAFKFFDSNKVFTGYLSPERLLFEYLRMPSFVQVHGDIPALLRYQVHYIGKAQDQPIERRLRSHESFQRILSREFPMIAKDIPTMEIALLFFGLDVASRALEFRMREDEVLIDAGGRTVSDEEICRALTGNIDPGLREAIGNDVEAYLINFMLPRYNRIHYANYPDIANGLRSRGFDLVTHDIIPFGTLVTEEATIEFSVEPVTAVG